MTACTNHPSAVPGTLSAPDSWDWFRKGGPASPRRSGFPLQPDAPFPSLQPGFPLCSPGKVKVYLERSHSPFTPKLFPNRFKIQKGLDEEETSGRDSHRNQAARRSDWVFPQKPERRRQGLCPHRSPSRDRLPRGTQN